MEKLISMQTKKSVHNKENLRLGYFTSKSVNRKQMFQNIQRNYSGKEIPNKYLTISLLSPEIKHVIKIFFCEIKPLTSIIRIL